MLTTRDNEYRTLTSPAGRFTFHKDVILSHCKLIRDAVTAQRLNPNPALPKIHTADDAQNYIFENVAGPANKVNFMVELV